MNHPHPTAPCSFHGEPGDGSDEEAIDILHAWLIEDLPGGRVRVLTQESQFGEPARKIHRSRPNLIANAHQDSPGKVARLRQLGATEVIDMSANAAWDEAVLRLTDGRGADHILDVIGGDAVPRSIQAAAWGRHICLDRHHGSSYLDTVSTHYLMPSITSIAVHLARSS